MLLCINITRRYKRRRNNGRVSFHPTKTYNQNQAIFISPGFSPRNFVLQTFAPPIILYLLLLQQRDRRIFYFLPEEISFGWRNTLEKYSILPVTKGTLNKVGIRIKV